MKIFLRLAGIYFFLIVSFALHAQCNFSAVVVPGHPILCPDGTDTLSTQVFDSYQWYKNSVDPGNEVGTNSNTFSINPVAGSDAGSYYVVVSGSCSPAITSDAAMLTVNSAPTITIHPNDETKPYLARA